MIINYQTKFNIGDTFYISEIFDGEYCVDGPHKVKSIQLEIVNDGVLIVCVKNSKINRGCEA